MPGLKYYAAGFALNLQVRVNSRDKLYRESLLEIFVGNLAPFPGKES